MSDPDTSFTDEPVCPYCGHEETDAWEIDFGGCDGDTEHSCGSCGEDYHLSRQVTFHYASSKKENSNEPR